MSIRKRCLLLLLAIGGGVFTAVGSVYSYEGYLTLEQLALMLSGAGEYEPLDCASLYAVMDYYFQQIPSYIFEIITGTLIYENFCTASVYVFTRETNRYRWYLSRIWQILGETMLFLMIMLTTTVLVTGRMYPLSYSRTGLVLLGYTFLNQLAWIMIWTLLLNEFCCVWGSSIAYVVTLGLQAGLFTLLYSARKCTIDGPTYWNPISWTVLSWQNLEVLHSEGIMETEMSLLHPGYSLALLYGTTIGTILFVGYFMIRGDILVERK